MDEKFHLIDDNHKENKGDWEISDLYKRAFEIVKKNKILWVFGAALAGLSSNFNSNSRSSFDSDSFQKIFNNAPKEASPSAEINQVLGAAATDFGQIFSNIPMYVYLLLGAEILLLVIFGIVTSLIYRAWVEGSLLIGTKDASEGKKVEIASSSERAFRVLKPMIFLNVVPGLLLTLISVAVFGLIILGFVFGDIVLKVILGFVTLICVLLLIYAIIMLTLTSTWAVRKAAFEQLGGKEAFKASIGIARKKFWPSLLLGVVNTILAAVVTMVPVAVLVAIIAASVAGFIFSKNLGLSLIATVAVLIVPFMVIMNVLGGVIAAFKASVWTLAYEKIKGKNYEHGN